MPGDQAEKSFPIAHTVNGSLLVSILAVLTVQPGLLPYSLADHAHSTAPLQRLVTNTVAKAIIERDLRSTRKQYERLARVIQFGLCATDDCVLEKADLAAYKLEMDQLNIELNRPANDNRD